MGVVERHLPSLFAIEGVVVASIVTVVKQYFSSCFSSFEAKNISIHLCGELELKNIQFIEINLCVPELLAKFVEGEEEEQEAGEEEVGEEGVRSEGNEGAGEGGGTGSPPSPVFIPPSKLWTYGGQKPGRQARLQYTPVLQPVTAEMLNAGQPARPGRVPKKELCGR